MASAAPLDPEIEAVHREFRSLVSQVKQGSEEAARELISQYGRHVMRVVRRSLDRQLRSKFDSMDFSQAVWLSFFRDRQKIAEFDQPHQLVVFLANVTRNKVIEETRRRFNTQKCNVEKERALVETDEGIKSSDPTASQVAIVEERIDELAATLPERYREIVRLVYQGVSHREIAEKLCIHERTVSKILARIEVT